MTYAEFTAYVMRYLWREGDTSFAVDLDLIIKSAEAKLTRDLKGHPCMTVTGASLPMPTTVAVLPAEARRLVSVNRASDGYPLTSTSKEVVAKIRAQGPTGFNAHYCIQGRNIEVPYPADLTLDYQRVVPSFKGTGAQFLVDDPGYFDLYLTAVLSESPMYLRNDERAPLWEAAYDKKLASVRDEIVYIEFGDAPLGATYPEGIV